MSHSWTEPQAGSFRDAYLDWSTVLKKRRDALEPQASDSGTPYEPIFVRLIGQDMVAARRELIDHLDASAAKLIIDRHELEFLNARVDNPALLEKLPDEYAIYRRVGTSDAEFETLFDVLDTGVPISVSGIAASPAYSIKPSPTNGAPIVAVIDDGIGFLNNRFRKSGATGGTRFGAVWMQALEQRDQNSAICGEVLDSAAIDALLSKGAALNEEEEYARINTRLFGQSGRSSNVSSTHGTHILDTAAGADPADTSDPVLGWPLLAVQLPPEAVEDTSGTRFESYVVQGLRWILHSARQMDDVAPIIVNISLGVLAGPKDGSRFIEYQAAREAAMWEEATGQRVRIVWSFGNSYLGRQVAQFDFEGNETGKNETQSVSLRVQPEDQTASYVEVHGVDVDVSKLQLRLTAPDGSHSGFKKLKSGELRSLTRSDGKSLARLYHLPKRDFGGSVSSPASYVFALAPTAAQKNGEPVAPCGEWKIDVRLATKSPARVSLQVQRDDGRGTFGGTGRQAYFDDAHAFEWSDETASYSGLGDDGPITHAGTHTAMVTPETRQVFTAGAAQKIGSNIRPARYAGAGSEWSVKGPTVSMVAEDGVFAHGILASGTLSGTKRALNGTSVAAARLSRALGLSAQKIVANASKGDHLSDLDTNVLALTQIPSKDADRLGPVVVGTPGKSARA